MMDWTYIRHSSPALLFGEDLDLLYYYDNAEVMLNVNLGKQFTRGVLYFGKMKNVRTSKNVYAFV